MELLGQIRHFGVEGPDWRLGTVDQDRLWTITLHYHGWLYVLAEAAVAKQDADARSWFSHYLEDWIHRCGLEQPGSTALAWNSYAIARRIGWWVRCYSCGAPELFSHKPELEALFLRSLWQQAAFLVDHIEYDLRANHLVQDQVGLALAGRFFDLPRARCWLRNAGRAALQESRRQVLSDGGHYERSPKYHLDVMDDFLLLALLSDDATVRRHLSHTWSRMAEWLVHMRHPDGGTAHFNDGEVLPASRIEACLAEGGRLGLTLPAQPSADGALQLLVGTGHAVWRGIPWTVFVDLGEVGPNEQPGHSHADTLTLEASSYGHRLIVDAGSFSYDADERRSYDRSTRAHNTVCIDGMDSSEVWHIFRLGRRAHPHDVEIERNTDGCRIAATHDGYRHLPGKPLHRRSVVVAGDQLRIEDLIEGRGEHVLEGSFLLEPSWRVIEQAQGWHLELQGVRVAVKFISGSLLQTFCRPSRYHPKYGLELDTSRIGWRWSGSLPCTVLTTFTASV